MISGGRRSTISGRFFDARTQVQPTAPGTGPTGPMASGTCGRPRDRCRTPHDVE